MEVYKVKDREELVKDKKSGAILLSQQSIANDYLAKKKALNTSRQMVEEINTLRDKVAQIDDIKKDMEDIKELLQRIVNR